MGVVMLTIRSRGIDSTEVWPWSGSKRTSRIVSLWGGSSRSSAFFESARRSEPRTRKVCGPPPYSGVTRPFGALMLAELREHLVGERGDLVQRHRGGRGAAQRDDQHARDREALPHAPPERGRALVIHGRIGTWQLIRPEDAHRSPRRATHSRSKGSEPDRSARAGSAGTLGRCSAPATGSSWACCPRRCWSPPASRRSSSSAEQLAGRRHQPHAQPRLQRVADLRRAVPRRCAWPRTS